MSDKELNDLKIDLASFTAKVTEWMSTTTEYRKSLCDKIDKINTKIEKLPCPKREWLTKGVAILYGLDIIIIGAIVTAFVTHIAR